MSKRKHIKIPVVILKTSTGFSAHSPIIDGCAATGKTIDNTLKKIKKALAFHLEGEQLVKNKINIPNKVLKEAFSEYEDDAFYATIDVAAWWYNLLDISKIPDAVLTELINNKEVVWKDEDNNKHYIIKIPFNKRIDSITDNDIYIEEIVELPIAINPFKDINY